MVTSTTATDTTTHHSAGRSLRVGTFNIRFDNEALHPLSQPNALHSRDQVYFGRGGDDAEEDKIPLPPWPPRQAQKGEEPWHKRRSYLADQIIFEDLALVGLQEVIHHQLEDLKVLLGEGYDYVGVGRDDGRQRGEAVPIFWKKDELQLLEVEHFWLSETPHVPGSNAWDSSMTRMATLAHFLDRKTGQTVYAINTHFDHRGPQSRIESSKLILSKLQAVAQSNALILLLGDLNSVQSDGGYQTLTGGAYGSQSHYSPSYLLGQLFAPVTFLDAQHELHTRSASASAASPPAGFPPLLSAQFGETYSNPGFPKDRQKPKQIDFIMFLDNGQVSPKSSGVAAGKWNVLRYGILPNSFPDSPLVSDHRLVIAELFTLTA